MESARGFLSKVSSGTGFGSSNNVSKGGMVEKNRFGAGIGNTSTGVKTMSYTNATSGYLGRWGEVSFIL